MPDSFIEHKSQQLIFYISRYFRGRLPHSELHLFVWDTLEEWAQLTAELQLPYNHKERVFWHLIHQLEYWPDQALRENKKLRRNIQDCICFLKGRGVAPSDCVGVRP
ncbi:hypothetical protein MN202_02490 [Rheinheimera muenzenbergensis]|uniref:Uncharacterized protein n=1 Tax=Rheinheimera muenzenbergensis TaxID=1193628 RepID=A0ABU8C2H4_9GAMM|nr:hypothetical protein [Gammaproteobacteria bacterium]MBU1556778.1 hypothetical protein [Gammaproteobacteria bacterium]MBU2072049.1 hypothetical protein [Gammaproteobacteria bacterium]MBU2183470.1 hypothetical protein [Gammaproteobacteria bacterium]MBU2203380.1 hypothetical protein [Gammaproteobacteria bacterium]